MCQTMYTPTTSAQRTAVLPVPSQCHTDDKHTDIADDLDPPHKNGNTFRISANAIAQHPTKIPERDRPPQAKVCPGEC